MCCALQMTQPSEVGEDIDYLSLTTEETKGRENKRGKGDRDGQLLCNWTPASPSGEREWPCKTLRPD